MADKPLSEPLIADLPEDWTPGQIIAPNGVDVDLPEQYGYNYLMAAVNRALRAVNTVNEGFETISGKRTARFTVGTSDAGWEEADCDYLCPGLDDQIQLNAACEAARAAGGGEVILLSGRYYLRGTVTVPAGVTLRGNGAGATVLIWEEGAGPAVSLLGALSGLECESNQFTGWLVDCPSGSPRAEGVRFSSLSALNALRCQGGTPELRGCVFAPGSTVLLSKVSRAMVCGSRLDRLELSGAQSCLICGNVFTGAVTLDAGARFNFVTGNQLTTLAGAQLDITDRGTDNIVRFNSGDPASPVITYGTTDLTPGTSPLPIGTVYLMYE